MDVEKADIMVEQCCLAPYDTVACGALADLIEEGGLPAVAAHVRNAATAVPMFQALLMLCHGAKAKPNWALLYGIYVFGEYLLRSPNEVGMYGVNNVIYAYRTAAAKLGKKT